MGPVGAGARRLGGRLGARRAARRRDRAGPRGAVDRRARAKGPRRDGPPDHAHGLALGWDRPPGSMGPGLGHRSSPWRPSAPADPRGSRRPRDHLGTGRGLDRLCRRPSIPMPTSGPAHRSGSSSGRVANRARRSAWPATPESPSFSPDGRWLACVGVDIPDPLDDEQPGLFLAAVPPPGLSGRASGRGGQSAERLPARRSGSPPQRSTARRSPPRLRLLPLPWHPTSTGRSAPGTTPT